MTGRVAGSSLQVAVAMRRTEMAPCSAYAGEMTVESRCGAERVIVRVN